MRPDGPRARARAGISWGGTWRSPLYLERSANGRQVKRIRIATNLACDDGAIWQGYTGFRGLAVRHGRFSLASDTTDPWDVGELHDVTTGDGAFDGARAYGTFGDEITVSNPVGETTARCTQRAAPWTAFSSAR